jgi:hypothetical protein
MQVSGRARIEQLEHRNLQKLVQHKNSMLASGPKGRMRQGPHLRLFHLAEVVMGDTSFQNKKWRSRESLAKLRHAAEGLLVPMQRHAHDNIEEIPNYRVW